MEIDMSLWQVKLNYILYLRLQLNNHVNCFFKYFKRSLLKYMKLKNLLFQHESVVNKLLENG